MNQLASQSAPVSPRGMPSLKVAKGRLNHSMFIRKMPNSAKPRTTSSASMRWLSATGANGAGLGGGSLTVLSRMLRPRRWLLSWRNLGS